MPTTAAQCEVCFKINLLFSLKLIYLEVSDQPLILLNNLLDSKLQPEVDFCRVTDNMCRTNVPTM